MLMDDQCHVCRCTIRPGDVYCYVCADHKRTTHAHETREAKLDALLREDMWQVRWHGPSGERWVHLYKKGHRGFAMVSVNLNGHVTNLTAHHLSAGELGTWFVELARIFVHADAS